MRKELELLRGKMQKEGIDAYLITTDDFHGSEYLGEYFKCREYISGFTGSAGTLVVMADQAGLWTDGRYFLQAQQQLAGSGITLYRSGEPGVPSVNRFLAGHLKEGQVLGYDGRCVMEQFAEELRALLTEKGVTLRSDVDLAGDVWEHRPPLSRQTVWLLDDAMTGMTRKKKMAQVRNAMAEKQADCFLLASLEDICWLLNVRGNDVACTPVVLSYVLMTKGHLCWYVQREAVPREVEKALQKDGVILRDYADIYEDAAALPEGARVLYDSQHAGAGLIDRLKKEVVPVEAENPTLLLKAVKNPTETEYMRRANLRDSVAMTKFIYWVKHRVGKESITELGASAYLEHLREQQEGYMGPSFAPIMAYGAHGAIVHYSADADSDIPLKAESFLLADTGGHYLPGTTDMTRTIALGPLTKEQKMLYTTVLRGNLQLAHARFLKGCTGYNLDPLARGPLWAKGYDYNHGTGHGVGYLLSVHEGPNAFRSRPAEGGRGNCVLAQGMITSDEPGVYLEGAYGIRLENLLLCLKDTAVGNGAFLKFEPLTWVPFEAEAILPEEMSEKEIRWLNAYQKTVYEKLAPYLDPGERDWLLEVTKPVAIK